MKMATTLPLSGGNYLLKNLRQKKAPSLPIKASYYVRVDVPWSAPLQTRALGFKEAKLCSQNLVSLGVVGSGPHVAVKTQLIFK